MNALKVIAVAAIGFAISACGQDTGSKDFLTEAIQGNAAEVQIGKLAVEKGSTDDVRNFGQTLQSDHTDGGRKARDVAQSMGLAVADVPTKDAQAEFDKLSKLEGPAFDAEFADHMIKDHKKDIDAYQKAAKSSDPRVAQYARDSLPVLQKHLATAQALKK